MAGEVGRYVIPSDASVEARLRMMTAVASLSR